MAVPAPKVDVIDTIGAGDTFSAGYFASLVESEDLERQWRMALRSPLWRSRRGRGVIGEDSVATPHPPAGTFSRKGRRVFSGLDRA